MSGHEGLSVLLGPENLFLPLMGRGSWHWPIYKQTYTELTSRTHVREAGESATFLHPVELKHSTTQSVDLTLWLVGVSSSYLLSLGADPELENECGEKPADLIDPDNKELLELFGLAVNDWELLLLKIPA